MAVKFTPDDNVFDRIATFVMSAGAVYGVRLDHVEIDNIAAQIFHDLDLFHVAFPDADEGLPSYLAAQATDAVFALHRARGVTPDNRGLAPPLEGHAS